MSYKYYQYIKTRWVYAGIAKTYNEIPTGCAYEKIQTIKIKKASKMENNYFRNYIDKDGNTKCERVKPIIGRLI